MRNTVTRLASAWIWCALGTAWARNGIEQAGLAPQFCLLEPFVEQLRKREGKGSKNSSANCGNSSTCLYNDFYLLTNQLLPLGKTENNSSCLQVTLLLFFCLFSVSLEAPWSRDLAVLFLFSPHFCKFAALEISNNNSKTAKWFPINAALFQPVPSWNDALPKEASAVLSVGADKEKNPKNKRKEWQSELTNCFKKVIFSSGCLHFDPAPLRHWGAQASIDMSLCQEEKQTQTCIGRAWKRVLGMEYKTHA